MGLAVDATVDGMNQAIPAPLAGLADEGGRDDALSAWSEDDVHRIVHAARHHRFHKGVSGAATEDMGSTGNQWGLARTRVGLLRECPLAPVDPSIES